MPYDPTGFARLRNRVLFVSALAWACLFARAIFASGGDSCAVTTAPPHSSQPAATLFKFDLATFMAIDWLLMVVAMMAPTLIWSLWHVRVRSFARRRFRSSALFVFGYLGTWMVAGALFFSAGRGLTILPAQSFWPAFILAMIALAWQTSPAKQRCLNRCHAHGSLAAFGTSADLDVLRFGVSHGAWCVGSCWALMLFPMLLPRGQVLAMATVSLLIFTERLERPASPGWRFHGLGAAKRIVFAQSRSYSRSRAEVA
jgi:predicted metal-binding membrane protein